MPNDYKDIWGLMDLLCPGALNNWANFNVSCLGGAQHFGVHLASKLGLHTLGSQLIIQRPFNNQKHTPHAQEYYAKPIKLGASKASNPFFQKQVRTAHAVRVCACVCGALE